MFSQCKSLTQETTLTNSSDTGKRVHHKETSGAAAEPELPAWCMSPKNQLKHAVALAQSPVSQTNSSPPPPLRNRSLFLATEGEQ